MKARLYLDLEFDENKTDAESIASAMDRVVSNGLAVLLDAWEPYGGEPKVGEFLVLDSEQAAEHADNLDRLIDNQDDELGESLVPVRDFLRRCAAPEEAGTSIADWSHPAVSTPAEDEGGESDKRYRNHYRCICGHEWTDEWDCTCNDRCPKCNTEIEPYDSEELGQGNEGNEVLYDVSVTRTSTASLTIRVEADDPNAAREKALELASDQDYIGCVVEYDFDADSAVEVAEENSLDCADETLPEGSDVADESAGKIDPEPGDGTCALCPTVFPGVSNETIDAGWLPSYFINDDECSGPVCPNCAKQFLRPDPKDGEMVLNLKGTYISQWDGGIEVESPCTVNPRTRKITIERTVDVSGFETCERECVEINGVQYEACQEEERGSFSPEEQSQMFFWD